MLKMLKFWALTIQSCGKLKLKLLQCFLACQPWALKGSNSMGNDSKDIVLRFIIEL